MQEEKRICYGTKLIAIMLSLLFFIHLFDLVFRHSKLILE